MTIYRITFLPACCFWCMKVQLIRVHSCFFVHWFYNQQSYWFLFNDDHSSVNSLFESTFLATVSLPSFPILITYVFLPSPSQRGPATRCWVEMVVMASCCLAVTQDVCCGFGVCPAIPGFRLFTLIRCWTVSTTCLCLLIWYVFSSFDLLMCWSAFVGLKYWIALAFLESNFGALRQFAHAYLFRKFALTLMSEIGPHSAHAFLLSVLLMRL